MCYVSLSGDQVTGWYINLQKKKTHIISIHTFISKAFVTFSADVDVEDDKDFDGEPVPFELAPAEILSG